MKNNDRTKLKTRSLVLHSARTDSVNSKKYITLLNDMRSKGELRLSYLSNIICKINTSLGKRIIR